MQPDYSNPHHILDSRTITEGNVAWRSPSNLALIKYWGKYGRQLPRNPSISITLDTCHTETHLGWQPRTSPGTDIDLTFQMDGMALPAFGERVAKFLDTVTDVFPFLRQLQLSINTHNSFPHSSGIASSASAMSALALCLCSLEEHFFGKEDDESAFLRKASYIARLGSGSACRSVYPFYSVWGAHGDFPDSSDAYGIDVSSGVHASFRTIQNAILIVSSEKKPISSTAGHGMMEQHPYADVRFAQARLRLAQLWQALQSGDWDMFCAITEDEALTLHALMMASRPGYILMQPNSLALIAKIRAFRAETGIPVCFSLDAGPNIHMLYPAAHADRVLAFIRDECVIYCEDNRWIADRAGEGPMPLNEP